MIANPEPVARCHRCGRPLSSPLATAARLGHTCALREAVEAAEGASGPVDGQRIAEAAISLVTARLGELPPDVVDGIVADAPAEDLAMILAGLGAWMIGHTAGGEQWLRKVGLAWAEPEIR